MDPPLPFPYNRMPSLETLLDELADRIALRIIDHLPTTPNEGDRLLTSKEVCEVLHISRSTLDRLAGGGTLPVIKLGSQNCYSEAEVQRFIEESAG